MTFGNSFVDNFRALKSYRGRPSAPLRTSEGRTLSDSNTRCLNITPCAKRLEVVDRPINQSPNTLPSRRFRRLGFSQGGPCDSGQREIRLSDLPLRPTILLPRNLSNIIAPSLYIRLRRKKFSNLGGMLVARRFWKIPTSKDVSLRDFSVLLCPANACLRLYCAHLS